MFELYVFIFSLKRRLSGHVKAQWQHLLKQPSGDASTGSWQVYGASCQRDRSTERAEVTGKAISRTCFSSCVSKAAILLAQNLIPEDVCPEVWELISLAFWLFSSSNVAQQSGKLDPALRALYAGQCPMPPVISFPERLVRRQYEQFWRAVAYSLLLSPLLSAHDYPWSGDQDSDISVMTKKNLQLHNQATCCKSHASASATWWEQLHLSHVIHHLWMAHFSVKAGQEWCNGYFIYCKQNFIFLTSKYAIQHSGEFKKHSSSKTEQIVCCCFIPSLLAEKCNSLVCWHSTHLFKISLPWMHSLIYPNKSLSGHSNSTGCTWQPLCILTFVAKLSYSAVWKLTCSNFTPCDHVSDTCLSYTTQCLLLFAGGFLEQINLSSFNMFQQMPHINHYFYSQPEFHPFNLSQNIMLPVLVTVCFCL